jgi:hypothetical protein
MLIANKVVASSREIQSRIISSKFVLEKSLLSEDAFTEIFTFLNFCFQPNFISFDLQLKSLYGILNLRLLLTYFSCSLVYWLNCYLKSTSRLVFIWWVCWDDLILLYSNSQPLNFYTMTKLIKNQGFAVSSMQNVRRFYSYKRVFCFIFLLNARRWCLHN